MEDMVPVLVLAVIGYFVLELVKVVSENRIRTKLIEKGMVDEKIKLLFQPAVAERLGFVAEMGVGDDRRGPGFYVRLRDPQLGAG